MCDWVTFNLPLDLASTVAGGIVGFVLVFVVDWIKRPRIQFLGFSSAQANFGKLYKFRFRLKGLSPPGLSRLTISWSDKTVFAKWDETPNPLERDDWSRFRPELVPATYDQPLFCGSEYAVPVIIERDGSHEIFSGWWFGKDSGYGPDPGVNKQDHIKLTLSGAGLSWAKEFTVDRVCSDC